MVASSKDGMQARKLVIPPPTACIQVVAVE